MKKGLKSNGKVMLDHVTQIFQMSSLLKPARSIASRISRRTFTSSPALSQLKDLHTFTEEEQMFREAVSKFSREVVGPRVRDMDENELVDKDILQALFDQGVHFAHVVDGIRSGF